MGGVRRRGAWLATGLAPLLIGCSNGLTAECHYDRCAEVVAAAARVIPPANARWFVYPGRGLAFHAEVHACYDDGRYFLVDVNGEMRAGVRQYPERDPRCP